MGILAVEVIILVLRRTGGTEIGVVGGDDPFDGLKPLLQPPGEQVKLAPKGAKPGGMVVRAVQVSGVIDAIDFTNRYVAVRGPKGNTQSLKAGPDVALDQLSVGDRIAITYTEALAIDMVAQAPAKKAPAKKEK